MTSARRAGPPTNPADCVHLGSWVFGGRRETVYWDPLRCKDKKCRAAITWASQNRGKVLSTLILDYLLGVGDPDMLGNNLAGYSPDELGVRSYEVGSRD